MGSGASRERYGVLTSSLPQTSARVHCRGAMSPGMALPRGAMEPPSKSPRAGATSAVGSASRGEVRRRRFAAARLAEADPGTAPRAWWPGSPLGLQPAEVLLGKPLRLGVEVPRSRKGGRSLSRLRHGNG